MVVTGGFVVVTGGSVIPHSALLIVFESRVTAPVKAKSRPRTSASVVAVIDACAMTVPTKSVPVPRVAELPTCQNTLHGLAPLISETLLFEPVMRVDPAWKMKTAAELPCASSVRGRDPVSPSVSPLYRPAYRVVPPSSTGTNSGPDLLAASVYATCRAAFAFNARSFLSSITPLVIWPCSSPLTLEGFPSPGLTPTEPLITDPPASVTVEPARIAYGSAAPRPTVGTTTAGD